MVDPGIAQAIVKRLNRWYRKCAKPHGKVDHYYRGIRMTRTAANRLVFLCFWLFLLFIVLAFFFVPDIFSGQSLLMKLLLQAGWLLMAVLVLVAPLQAMRDFVVVTDDGLIKPKLFGGETRVAWSNIVSFHIKPDSNEVNCFTGDNTKCQISLAYNGWQDLLETASKHLNRSLFYQLTVSRQNLDIQRTRPANKSTGLKR